VALKRISPATSLALVTNAPPAGMTQDEIELYADIAVVERKDMSRYLVEQKASAVVVDTAVLPGISALDARLGLLLRETRAGQLHRFVLDDARPWDLLMIPNPPDHWQPEARFIPTRCTETPGWIYRCSDALVEQSCVSLPAVPRLLIASGGGGSGNDFSVIVGQLISRLKAQGDLSFTVSQVLGPRAGEGARIDGADEYLRPGPRLHELFARYDLVISTAGYNSTLELACTDVPVLFIPLERTYDDQVSRARYWAPQLGHCHSPTQLGESQLWIRQILQRRQRRAPVDIGVSGATSAAEVLKKWLH
jgi:hypothetical protein